MPSKAQRALWERLIAFRDRVGEVRESLGARLVMLSNGDAVEGDHHKTTQILSGNLEAQTYVLHEMLALFKELNPEKWFVVRGTETHVGPSGSAEEAMGRSLGAVPDPDTHTWSAWRHRITIHGVRIDAQHHGRVGGRPWTKNAICALAFQIFSEHVLRGEDFPHIALRSHCHTAADSENMYPTRAIGTPAWQLKTGHAHKVVAEAMSTVGGIIIVIYPDGKYTVENVFWQPELPKATVIA